MSPTLTRWRYFFVHQDPAQEAWLEEQARHGLHLVRPGLFRFQFAQGEPREEKYRLDFQILRGAARDEYLTIFRDAGWDFLGQVANRYYFRARTDAIAPEIFSDVESRKERIRRQMRVAGVLTGLLIFQAAMGARNILAAAEKTRASLGAPILALTLAGSFALLGIWTVWKMQQALKRER